MRKFLNIVLFYFIINNIAAQNLPSFQAPEPSKVYEFTKYDQIPVGEYTGVPNIGIPLYSIKLDDVEIPIGLQYHAGGFKVSEEASNVGLGWNMNFGMITQTIQDKDDLQTIQNFKKLLIYQDSPTTGEWPIICTSIYGGCNSFSYLLNSNCAGVQTFPPGVPKVTNSIFIATKRCYPIQGISYCSTDGSLDEYLWDSEPDIFRVSFFGHSLKFIKRFDTTGGTIEILNNKGYKIEMTENGSSNPNENGTVNWKIITPNGDQFIFGRQRQDFIGNNSWGNPLSIFPTENPGSTTGGTSYNNSWSLIKIITNKSKEIDFEYFDFGISTSRNYSQTLLWSATTSMYTTFNSPQGMTKGYYGRPPVNTNNLITSVNASYEKALYVSKITSPNETVTFQYSDRNDRGNDKKLDVIEVKNIKGLLVDKVNFNYDYFISDQGGGDIAPPVNGVYTTDLLRRLKLVSVKKLGENPYVFGYNPTQLPKKISNAVDYWGFYNGQLNNTSLAPNPMAIGYSEFGNNGNNKHAFESFTKACVLERITYPLGGSIVYDYEINKFERLPFETIRTNADGVPTETIHGNGIRIKSISLYDKEMLQKKTNFTYSGGKSLIPFEIMTSYSTNCSRVVLSSQLEYSTISVKEFYSSNFYKPSLLGTFNSIGYDKVAFEEVGLNSNGKTVLSFMNVRDEIPHYDPTATYNKLQLPSIMRINTTENGKILSKELFDKNNDLVQKTDYTYSTRQSNIYYGNSILTFRGLISYSFEGSGGPDSNFSYTPKVTVQELVGYYAIYGKHSLLSTEKVTDYFPSGSKWNITSYSYNANNLITSIETTTQFGNAVGRESTTYYSTPNLIAKNLINLPQQKTFFKNGQTNSLSYTYQTSGLNLPEKIELMPSGNPSPSFIKRMFYDQYDDLGNLLQFHSENGVNTCIIWGYNMTLPIAKIDNAVYSQVSAYVANLQNLSNTGTEDNLINALDNLRTTLPNAMITGYTHIPGMGVSSITDAKGSTVYYKYDGAGRLESMKDEDKKLLLEYEYHFRPQN